MKKPKLKKVTYQASWRKDEKWIKKELSAESFDGVLGLQRNRESKDWEIVHFPSGHRIFFSSWISHSATFGKSEMVELLLWAQNYVDWSKVDSKNAKKLAPKFPDAIAKKCKEINFRGDEVPKGFEGKE